MIRLEDLTEPEIHSLLTSMGRAIEKCGMDHGLHPKPYFTLLLWNDPKVTNYVSNGDREWMIGALRETADMLERREDVCDDF